MASAIILDGARAILCGLFCSGDRFEYKSSDASLAELEDLLKTAGGTAVATVLQNRVAPEKFALLGEGKLEEIAESIKILEADIVIFDNSLSPSQISNMEKIFNVPVIDRSMLILEIFAMHATTHEGKLQVTMAHLKYTLPRLTGRGTEMSRLGGGGAGGGGARRGAGETKLEIDRRNVKETLASIRAELEELAENRAEQRKQRDKSGTPKVALIGYTNAGKSTLLNKLTNAGVLAENKLFATLDPTTRKLKLENGFEILLTDTVGFIKDLPHQLVDAFKSTLDEVRYADLLVNVVDATDSEAYSQYEVTVKLVEELGAVAIPMLTALNKCDGEIADVLHIPNSYMISAKTGEGIDELLEAIYSKLTENHKTLEYLIPYDKGALVDMLHTSATSTILETEYRENGVYLKAVLDAALAGKCEEYLI